MLTFEQVMECIRKEGEYAKGWGTKGQKVSVSPEVDDCDVHSGTCGPVGQPFSISDLFLFAKKYWDEIPLAMSNFTPDGGAVRIRVIKVVSLLVRALMLWGRPSDLERLAGQSSRDFPILSGGLKTFNETTTDKGCMIPQTGTGKLRNENPHCDPLR